MAKILIVDDDFETLKLLEGIIRFNGHEPLSVNESRRAIQSAETFMPDLILLDIMMAEIDGITICRTIKSSDQLKNIPVVMVSALHDERTKKEAFAAGANEYTTKPIYPNELIQRINQILAKKTGE